ncbi:MAG: type III pantothenate kinase [Rhodospirillales bacterium]|nr:type III pantothenate kinase [Alphaproteobacteria bacterium]MBL6947861.1 type III pantothenate kinase [Rhodospirillales bacterium]
MLLCIDSGNTNIVFAVYDDQDSIRGQWRSSTHSERTADEFGVWLSQLMSAANITAADITACIIASVVPATMFSLKSLCRDYFGCDPLVIGEDGVELGLDVLVDRPNDVGADRLVNAVSAHQLYGGPLVIVDFGTATTFDVIDGDGNYVGGVIAPGVNLSLEALHMAAAQLPRVGIQRTDRVTGKSTVEAMQSGIYWGYVGLIEGLVKRLSDEHSSKDNGLTVIATGGLARLFSEATDCIGYSDPDLTLRGLLAIYRKNS